MASIKTIYPNLCAPGTDIIVKGANLENINGYKVYNDILSPASASASEVVINLALDNPYGVFDLVLYENDLEVASYEIRITPTASNNYTLCVPDYKEIQYRTAIRKLLPRGIAWAVKPGGVIENILESLAFFAAEANARMCDLIKETSPLTSTELIKEWEESFGIPGECSNGLLGDTLNARRNAVYQKMLARGGQNKAFFIALAAQFGYRIQIEEYTSTGFKFGAGIFGETPLTNYAHYWKVNILDTTPKYFIFGSGIFGKTPLVSYVENGLECIFNKFKPAHTIIIYDFTEVIENYIDENGATDIIDENGATNIITENTL